MNHGSMIVERDYKAETTPGVEGGVLRTEYHVWSLSPEEIAAEKKRPENASVKNTMQPVVAVTAAGNNVRSLKTQQARVVSFHSACFKNVAPYRQYGVYKFDFHALHAHTAVGQKVGVDSLKGLCVSNQLYLMVTAPVAGVYLTDAYSSAMIHAIVPEFHDNKLAHGSLVAA